MCSAWHPRAGRPDLADERSGFRSRGSGDDAEEISVGVSQHNEVGIFGILPINPLRAERDQSLNLGLLIGLIVG